MINHQPAKEKGLGCSLFQRYAELLENSNWDMTLPENSMLMLTTQYRMVFRFFVSLKFKAHSSVSQHFCSLEGFWPRGPKCPIAFCDIVGKEEGTSSHHKAHQESKCNRIEANKIVIYS